MVVVWAERAIASSSTVPDGLRTGFLGHRDFFYLPVNLTVVYFFGTIFLGFLLQENPALFLYLGFITW